jgi:hypothetical protein
MMQETSTNRRLLVVLSQLGRLGGDPLEDVIDKRVEDKHGLVGDTSVGVDLLEDLVDVGRVCCRVSDAETTSTRQTYRSPCAWSGGHPSSSLHPRRSWTFLQSVRNQVISERRRDWMSGHQPSWQPWRGPCQRGLERDKDASRQCGRVDSRVANVPLEAGFFSAEADLGAIAIELLSVLGECW